jgi:hypothetical protein
MPRKVNKNSKKTQNKKNRDLKDGFWGSKQPPASVALCLRRVPWNKVFELQ